MSWILVQLGCWVARVLEWGKDIIKWNEGNPLIQNFTWRARSHGYPIWEFTWIPTAAVLKLPNTNLALMKILEKCAKGICLCNFLRSTMGMTVKQWLRIKWGGSLLKDLESSLFSITVKTWVQVQQIQNIR